MALLKKATSKRSAYQICVTILEARHLQQSANPVIVVKVGNQRKKTMVREKTDCPVYNEYFVFDFVGNMDALLSTRVIIAVYLRNCLRQLKFYGSIEFEVGAVWDQPDHQYYHKWAMLTDPKSPSIEPKGYVKCNITINAKGQRVKVYPETDGEDDIEGNLLLPLGGERLPFRQRARYIFVVYRADCLPDMSSMCAFGSFENINPYVQISFAGMKGKTNTMWHTYYPNFNERITFKEMFPSFCQRIRITLKHRIDSCRSCVVATRLLHTKSISNSGEYGFLPTYGPSFLHFYASRHKERHSCTGKRPFSLPFYRGRLLLSLKTEMDDPEALPRTGVETELTAPIIEKSLWSTDEYILVAILYDVCMIDRWRFLTKSISFEVSLGNAGNRQFSRSRCIENNGDEIQGNSRIEGWSDFESRTVPRATGTFDGKYNYLPLGSKKPCIHVKSWWPNLQWRMFNTNDLRFIARFLETKLEEVGTLAALENPIAYETYNEAIDTLKDYCLHYLHTLDTGRYDEEGGTTKLDRHRVNVCRKRIESVLRRIKINGKLPNNHYIKIAMVHAYRYLQEIEEICEDPQDALPHVFLWMLAGSKRVAYTELPAERIIYSEVDRERGENCGRRMNVFMRKASYEEGERIDYFACQIELFLWLGNAKFANACWSSIPPGYVVDYERNVDSFPRYIEYDQYSAFQLRAHIFQGRFEPGMDSSGLLDAFVCVSFYGHTLSTKVERQSLDPFWDQTLLFPSVKIHGTKQHIKEMPPKVILQAFDEDLCGTKEFCGKCMAAPLVKLACESFASPGDFPVRLQWYKFQSQRGCSGAILAAFELIETDEEIIDVEASSPAKDQMIYGIPENIRPKMAKYRLEVVFWGVRDMKKVCYTPVHKPRIVIECAGVHVKSEVMENAKKFSNFKRSHVMVEMDMAELDIYYPSITVRAYDSRGFGCFKHAGICIVPSVHVFMRELITEEEYRAQIYEGKSAQTYQLMKRQSAAVLDLPEDYDPTEEESRGLIDYKRIYEKDVEPSRLRRIWRYFRRLLSCRRLIAKRQREKDYNCTYEDDTLDWWSKYFASLEKERSTELGLLPPADENLLPCEKSVATLKGHISIYRWPHPENVPCRTPRGRNVANGICDDYPSQEPIKLLVRLYVVRGINLQPKDPLTGKSDPYIYVKLAKKFINDRKNYIPNQLNPTFGRVFELEATLPQDYMLTVQVWDYDSTTSDDLIGETQIDIENRFYSRHRAKCGLARRYNSSGYNAWRDREKPKQILEYLCKKNNLPLPIYRENEVAIDREESMALHVLHQWQNFPVCGCALVPEHVERRPLFNTSRPGLEQGRLELWVDMFACNQPPPKEAVDITPHKPEEYEIRVIVWNTEDVPLVESQFLTGEKSSDIYVKGWILYEDRQKTDVHYNSLTGEGNFNWRFVFRVTYLNGENVMIVRKKMSILARTETEQKLPCRLHLEVWDSDHFSPDDFLGALSFDLAKMPHGSGNSKTCTMNLLNGYRPTVNLFTLTKIRAWWPFAKRERDGTYIQAGKVELELSVVRGAEADENPVGRGRNPPQELPSPNRPDTSFSWFRNPWKAFRYVVCRYYKWRIILCFICVLLLLLVACAIYAFPGYTVKRLLGA